MDIVRIAELLHPYAQLSQKELSQTSTYLDLLLKWNARTNLTAVRNPNDIITRHFGESFFAARQLLPSLGNSSVIDLGSGAGFPGIPQAMLTPSASVTLIESSAKKVAFLNEVIHALQLSNARTVRQRGKDYRGHATLVIMRAVEEFEKSAQVALSLVEPGGRLALMIGESQVEQATVLLQGVDWREPIAIPGSRSRVILAGTRKVKVE